MNTTAAEGTAPAAAGGGDPVRSLDRDNPWPGLTSYDESGRLYFNGRDGEVAELLGRVLDEPLTVLFGRSGLGKSSLLKAGLFPLLRERGLFPVYIRLQLHPQAPRLAAQVRALLEEEVRVQSIEHPEWPPDETLWHYMHRCGLEFWDSTNRLVKPVLVFDQFEEVFTLGRKLPQEIERFRTEMADLIENRVPASLYSRLESEGATVLCLDLKAMPYKVLLSLREDFLADLEHWRASIPSLRRNRMRLLPMRTANALQAIHNERTAHVVDEAQARQIVAFLAARTAGDAESASVAPGAAPTPDPGDDTEIDPALLSLFCAGINLRRQRAGKARFDDELIGAAKRTVVADFYRESVADLPSSARVFIENELITEQGYRNSYAVCDAIARGYLSEEQLGTLVNRRLLRRSHVLGTDRIELTHDLLTKAVAQERDTRLKAERAEKESRDRRRVRLWIAGAVGAILASVGMSIWFARLTAEARDQRAQAMSRQLAAMATKEIGRNHELATWLAGKAFFYGETEQAREAFFDTARFAWPHEKIAGVEQLGGAPTAIAISTSGKYLAVLARAVDDELQTGATFLSLWNVGDARRRPERVWIRRVDIRDADRVVLSRDREARLIAIGGGRAIELLDRKSGDCALRLSSASAVKTMAFGGRSGPFFGWAGDQVHIVPTNPAENKDPTAAATGCSQTGSAADGVPVPVQTLDVDEAREIAFVRGNTLLLLRLRPNGSFELRRYVPDAQGTWRHELRELLMDCPADAALSLGANRYSATLSPATCAFSVDRDSNVSLDDRFETAESNERRWVRNVVWAAFGVAHLKVLGDGELEVSGPDFAKRWRVHLKGVDFPAHRRFDASLKNELALSASGRRVAAVGHREAAVTVYYLEPRPFFAELAHGTFAVAPDASWVVLETERRRREHDSRLSVFERKDPSGTYEHIWSIELPSYAQSLAATADTVVVALIPRPDEETPASPSDDVDVVRGDAPVVTVGYRALKAAGASGAAQILERPATVAEGAGGPRRITVGIAAGSGDSSPSSSAAADAAQAPAADAKAASVTSLRAAVANAQSTPAVPDDCRIPRLRDQRSRQLSPQWSAFWDQRGAALVDASCRDFGRYEIAGVSGIGLEGGGSLLRIDLDGGQRSMLIPLERRVIEALGHQLATRDYAPDLCRIARIDCDKDHR